MNKRKSITLLVISIVLILLLGVMTFCPVVVPLGNVDYHSPVTLIEYGLDLKGGYFVTFEVNKNELSDSEYAEGFDEVIATLEDRMSLIESRMGIQGFTEALVASSPAEGLVSVEVPATESALSISDVFDILGSKGELVISLNEDGSEPFIPKNAQGDELTWNDCIVRADAIYDSSTSSYGIYVEFDDFGLEALKEGTSAITSSTPIYFILDGETISNPNVSSQITSNYSQITGLSTPVAAQTMAIQFMSGSYPLDVVNTMDFNDVGAELGNDTANMLLLVYAVMSILIIVAFIAVYRLMGVAFTLSFLFYLILLAFAIAFIPLAQFMSLAGFVGLFFGLAMFAAFNAVLLGNINSEFKKGKSFELSFDYSQRRYRGVARSYPYLDNRNRLDRNFRYGRHIQPCARSNCNLPVYKGLRQSFARSFSRQRQSLRYREGGQIND